MARDYRPAVRERWQDWLMGQMSADGVLRSRLLRFIDTYAAVDRLHDGALIKRLFREYLAGPFPRSSRLLRLALAIGRLGVSPAGLVSALSRGAIGTLAGRFIAGPDSPAVLNILAYLEQQGRYATFDLLGEDVFSEHEAELCQDRYLALVDRLAAHPWAKRRTPAGIPALQLSIKLTSLTHTFNPADPEGTLRRVAERLGAVARRCASTGIGLNVDAELFEHRELTWHIFSTVFGPRSALGRWDGAGITVQSYFTDSADYLRTVLDFAAQRGTPFEVRLAKGAYWDYEVIAAGQNDWPVPVFRNKSATDLAFQGLLAVLLEHSREVTVAVAGHNIRDHAYAEALRELFGLPPGVVEHQTLFHTAEGVSRAIKRMGWELREYVPSGELVPGMAYVVRRVLENTSPAGFLMQSRGGKDPAALLRPPDVAGSPDMPVVAGVGDGGFRNHPPKRLFLAAERRPFESALKETRAGWGQEYPLELAGRRAKTELQKASLSPSRPDPGQPVGLVHMAGADGAREAVNAAREGFARWAATSPDERCRILSAAAGLLGGERDGLAAWIVHEGGRTWAEALADVDEAVDHLAYNARRLLSCRTTLEEHYRPRGVVAVISPWNFPAALPAGMLSVALAAGNAVILKSAEQTPIIASRLVGILHSAGVPRDALIHLPGWGEAGAFLVESPQVDMVAFTGSRAVGLGIVRRASAVRLAAGIKKVVAEMGGKNAIIVFPDADLDEAVRGILLSAFEHANQKCSACSRVFVHRSILERLRERLIDAAASLPVGLADDPGTLVNPLIEPEAGDRVRTYAQMARSEGRVLVDRINVESPSPLLVGPMVVELEPSRVSTSAIAREEIFGPVLALVPFEDEGGMLAMVNGSEYALTAGVFSRSPATVARMLRLLQAGNIYVNRKITGARVAIEPFGGFKLSGTGPKAGSPEYLFAFVTRRDGYRPEPSTSVPPDSQEPQPFPLWERPSSSLPLWKRACPEPVEGGTEGDSSDSPQPASPHLAEQLTPWSARVLRRCDVLGRSIKLLETEFHGPLLQALAGSYGCSQTEAAGMAGQLASLASSVLESAAEIAGTEPTLQIPGQKSYVNWRMPRGKGSSPPGTPRRPAGLPVWSWDRCSPATASCWRRSGD